MGIIDKIKNRIEEKKQVKLIKEERALSEQALIFHDQIITEMEKFAEDSKVLKDDPYLIAELEKRKEEVQDKILGLIEECPRVLTVLSENIKLTGGVFKGTKTLMNVGMFASKLGLLRIVDRALEDEEASTQQDEHLHNLGMICAIEGQEEQVIKAMDNKIASLQQSVDGRNLLMLSARYGLEKATLKGVENYEACKELDKSGKDAVYFLTINGHEDSVVKLLDTYPELCYRQYYITLENIGHLAIPRRYTKIISRCLEDPVLSTQQDNGGMTLSANMTVLRTYRFQEEDLILKSLDNRIARNKVDNLGMNALDNLERYEAGIEILEKVQDLRLEDRLHKDEIVQEIKENKECLQKIKLAYEENSSEITPWVWGEDKEMSN